MSVHSTELCDFSTSCRVKQSTALTFKNHDYLAVLSPYGQFEMMFLICLLQNN